MVPRPGGTRVRASTLLFDQPVDRFLSTLPAVGGAAGMTATLPLRVMVQDAWDEVSSRSAERDHAGRVKRRALEATRVTRDPAGYVSSFAAPSWATRSQSLADAGLVPNGALIVLPRRRRPVR